MFSFSVVCHCFDNPAEVTGMLLLNRIYLRDIIFLKAFYSTVFLSLKMPNGPQKMKLKLRLQFSKELQHMLIFQHVSAQTNYVLKIRHVLKCLAESRPLGDTFFNTNGNCFAMSSYSIL